MNVKNLIVLISALVASSCGSQKTAIQSGVPKVQTTFFNARFGESISSVKRKIEREYNLYHTGKRNSWKMKSVPFAGYEWPDAFIYSVNSDSYSYSGNIRLFSRIGFIYDSSDKEKAADRFNDVYRLLSGKYPLARVNKSSQAEKEYTYTDSDGNFVALILTRDKNNADAWLCILIYAWGKAEEVEIYKAKKDI